MDHVFIMMDVTSMRLDKAAIKSITMLRTDDKGNQIIAITQNLLTDANSFRVAFEEFRDITYGEFVIVSYFGHDFYRPLLNDVVKNTAVVTTGLENKPWLSLEQIAWPLYFDEKLADRKLETLAKYLGVGVIDPRFMSDKLWLLHQCYWTLMRRLTTGMLFESKAREKGGRFFETAQQLIRRF